MTRRDLIAELQRFSSDGEVFLRTPDGLWSIQRLRRRAPDEEWSIERDSVVIVSLGVDKEAP